MIRIEFINRSIKLDTQSFSYWPMLEPRQGNNIYEMRSYRLRPGSMIEWGNNWARAINYRQKSQEVIVEFRYLIWSMSI